MQNVRDGITTEATNQPLDRRIRRTRQLLRDALFQLIIERGYENIAILDITEQANLGRTTFYLHYQDKDGLLKASLRGLLQELQGQVEPIPGENCPYYVRCIRIFEHVDQRRPLYQALLKETGPVNIGNMLRDYFAELFGRYLFEERNNLCTPVERTDLIAAHAAGSLFGLISWWLMNEDELASDSRPANSPRLTYGLRPAASEMGMLYFRLMTRGIEDVSRTLES